MALSFKNVRENLYQEFLKAYCQSKKIDLEKCPDEAKQSCARAAEARAYISTIIPEEVNRFSILNVDGKDKEGKEILDVRDALRVKNIICQYCWNKTWEKISEENDKDDKRIRKYIHNNSCMDKRRQDGANVMIWGGSKSPQGKTMMASIIMREAIRLRLTKNTIEHDYAWVSWGALKSDIFHDTFDMAIYRSCDWLVIDDIEDFSLFGEEKRSRISGMIEPFFSYRMKNNVPTIFVFKFDLSDRKNISSGLGTTIASIYNRDSTFKISLGGKDA